MILPEYNSTQIQQLQYWYRRCNSRIYNLVSVPQITRILFEDAIIWGNNLISSKTHNGSKKEKRNYGKVKNSKTMLKILLFIRILYLKQQHSIL